MITVTEVPHFCFLKPVELPEKFEYEVMRNRALKCADSNPIKYTICGHPKGAGILIVENYVDYYWNSINKDLKEILEILEAI